MQSQFSPFRYLNLLFEVVSRDIKKKYYKSALGVVWTVLNPLLMMLVLTLVFSTLFKHSIDNFPVYYLCASLIFSFNADATTQSLDCIVGNSSLISKMYIPKYIFCVSRVVVSFVTMLFSLVALVVVILVTGGKFSLYMLLTPILLIFVFMFSVGLSLILATYGVFFRDLKHLYGILVMAWTYMTPIFYPVSIVPEKLRFLWELNPLYHYITIMRDLVYIGTLPTQRGVIIAALFSALSLITGVVIFKQSEGKLLLYI